MRVAVLETGEVRKTIAGRLSALGFDVVLRSRDRQATMASTRHSRRPTRLALLASLNASGIAAADADGG